MKKSVFRLRNTALIGLAIVLTLSGLSFSPGWRTSRRAPTAHEMVLYYFAQNVGETALCERISWAAYQRYSVLFGGGGSSYLRSDCYERVAQTRRDAGICAQVRPLVDFDPLSSGYSVLSCRTRTRAQYRSGTGLSDVQLVRIFERMGYDIDAIHIDGVMQAAIRLRDVYGGLEHDRAALARARQILAAPGNPLALEDRRYIAHLAAIGSEDPRWCESIPAAAPTDPEAPSRDWCYLTLAHNTGDLRLCERMTPASEEAKVRAAVAQGVRPSIAAQLGLHGDCLRVATRMGPAGHYGPRLPTHDEQTRRLLSALQVVVPTARDWTANQQAGFYQRFLFALWPSLPADPHRPADAAREVVRRDLVQRLLALPDGS